MSPKRTDESPGTDAESPEDRSRATDRRGEDTDGPGEAAALGSGPSRGPGGADADESVPRPEEPSDASGWLNPATARKIPHGLVGLGLLLVGVIVAEAVAFVLLPIAVDVVAVVNMLTSLPFVGVLVAVGYQLRRGEYGVDRYPRVAAWTVAGLLFLGGFFTLIALFTQDAVVTQVGVVRWGVAAGAGAGALAGFFEARAIERAVTAEGTRIRNEELRRQNERLDDFANIIAHDLRNPLAVVSGRVEMAKQATDDTNLDSAISSLERMEEIIEETLTLARSGAVIDEPEAVDLTDLAGQCWGNVEVEGATLDVEDPPTISADRDRLQHLFENLFRNAVEHGSTSPQTGSADAVEHSSTSERPQADDGVEHGGSDVTVRVGGLPDGFYVEDTGPGIPESDRETVFDPGYSTSPDGTGFGLAIVKQIADAHGWDITVTESQAGGARFEVTGVPTVEAVEALEATMMATVQQ